MAHLWTEDAEGKGWAVAPLLGSAYGVSGQGLSLVDDRDRGPDGLSPSALLVRGDSGSLEQWLLLARKRGNVQVNGWPLVLGVRLLCDRDELVVRADGASAALRCFFSAERLAEVVAYPGGDGAVRCPRCKQPMERNQMAVRCPSANCGAWHHQEAALPCWTYSATCAVCDRPTRLDAGLRWTPEKL
ncbi:MAG: hypothetical protein ACLQLG_20220 [Thermoguttaceae bacterium]